MFVCNRELGLPISNLTSQLFANFYLNGFDHYCKSKLGLRYFGAIVKGRVILTGKRAVKGMRKVIGEYNYKVSKHPLSEDEEEHFLQSLNSYLGLMRHHSSLNLRKKVREWLSSALDKLYYVSPEKIIRKEKVRLLRH